MASSRFRLTTIVVDAGRFDDSDVTCRSASDHDEQHGLHQFLLAREPVAFDVIRGSLENVAETIDLPPMPNVKGQSYNNIDRVLLAQTTFLAMTDDARMLRVRHPVRPHVSWQAKTSMAAAHMLHLIEPARDQEQAWLPGSLDPAMRAAAEIGS